jgi:hypothetical protein
VRLAVGIKVIGGGSGDTDLSRSAFKPVTAARRKRLAARTKVKWPPLWRQRSFRDRPPRRRAASLKTKAGPPAVRDQDRHRSPLGAESRAIRIPDHG